MQYSGCVELHQKFRDFVGLPMGLLREESPKTCMNNGLFGSRSGEYGLKVHVVHPSSPSANLQLNNAKKAREIRHFPGFFYA